ncbi:hypothetical protein Tco_0132979, partial [Tanacetum coccineum]
ASSDDDPLYSEDIDYVEASPLDYELITLEEVNDDILREKLLNIDKCTDISKITRKPSKNGQTRIRERKSVQEPKAKVKKSNLGQ